MKFYQLVLVIMLAASNHFNDNSIQGIWISETDGTMIKIDKVGTSYLGRIVWLPGDQSIKDEKNPDPKLRNIPVKGLKVIYETTESDGNDAFSGTFYNYQTGKIIKVEIVLANNKLTLSGNENVIHFKRK